MSVPTSISELTSYFPHVKVPVPIRNAPRRRLKIYLDSELGLVIHRREPTVIQRFCEVLDEDMVFFDVGAHIGIYSILASAVEGIRIHAFEPHPENAARIRENVAINAIETRVTVCEAAVSDSVGMARMGLSNRDTEHSLKGSGTKYIPVRTTTLDAYCETNEVTPNLVKIDVEGAGAAVLEGSRNLLEEGSVWFVETHSSEEERSFRKAFNAHNYQIEEINTHHIFAISRDVV